MEKSTLTSRERLERQGQPSSVSRRRNKDRIDNLIVIGTSAGGYRALAEIFKDLSVDMPAVIAIVLHTPKKSLFTFNKILGRYCRLPIKEVVDQERLQQGFVFVPPPGTSAEFTNGMIRVKHDVANMRLNTINHMFKSAARSYGERVIGLILTGLWKDGTEGLAAVHGAGGLTMVQDPREAEYRDMPANAMKELPVTFCLRLAEIGPALELLVRRLAQFETGLAVAVRTLRERVALLVRMSAQSQRNPETQAFLKNELASLRHDLQAIEDLVAKGGLDTDTVDMTLFTGRIGAGSRSASQQSPSRPV
jgi:two-component system chemotaxis response regulator CheB